ncbi:MAG: hypothetical protein IKL79_04100 [Clostridia bacterium]|nr:hypothetical protein [Clostridia bacterium]
MKKLICLLLCVVMLGGLLVGCKNDDIVGKIDEELKKLEDKVPTKVVEEMEFDFYIIVGEGTTENAKKTVSLMINQHLEKFKTTLDIHYLTAAEYEEKAKADIALDTDDKADILLVTSAEMFDYLYENRLVANLTDYYHPTASAYRSLNTQIAASLLSAVTVHELAYTNDGTEYIAQNKYCVPNNRIVGSYDIFLMSVEAAEYYNIGSETFDALSPEELEDRIYAKADVDPMYSREECVTYTSGSYAELTEYINSGKYYVKYSVPEITREEAYESVFVIARHSLDNRHVKGWKDTTVQSDIDKYTEYYNRCMEIIYEINTNTDLRNLLQYGKVNTNCKLDRETNTVSHNDIAENDVYNMNIEYTGDVFKAYYCECDDIHIWSEEMAAYGEIQNKDAVLSPEEYGLLVIEGDMQLIDLRMKEQLPDGDSTLVEAEKTLSFYGTVTNKLSTVWTVNGEVIEGSTYKIEPGEQEQTLTFVLTVTYTDGDTVVSASADYTVTVAVLNSSAN